MKSFLLLALVALAWVSCTRNHADDHRAERLAASVPRSDPPGHAQAGRVLFLKNCAHCHGADAHGNEGPDLHNLDWTNEEIAARIRNGKKGQMTAFAGKLSKDQIREVIDYLRTLK